jgi:hypothetical protein
MSPPASQAGGLPDPVRSAPNLGGQAAAGEDRGMAGARRPRREVLAFHSRTDNDGDDVHTGRVWRRVLGLSRP